MPTKSEAAEALYRAADALVDTNRHCTESTAVVDTVPLIALYDACHIYRDATPDALPAEVQRVVEAAGEVRRIIAWADPDEAMGKLIAAVDAYRSSQPEPLSARLARLGKGARVRLNIGSTGAVEANAPQHERLWLVVDGNERHPMMTCTYADIDAILSESP